MKTGLDVSRPAALLWRVPAIVRTAVPVLAVAALAAALHLVPYWHAESQVPPGWSFTGNVRRSPDFVQYRVWMRQSEQTGMLVANTLTSEPNVPHIPVLLYAAVSTLSRWIGLTPERVYAYAGSVFVFLLVLALFATVRLFLRSATRTWSVFALLLLGGGLGGHLHLLQTRLPGLRDDSLVRRLLFEPLGVNLTFEDYRGHYVFSTLFDTQLALHWLVATAAALSVYFTLRNFSIWRVALTAGLYGMIATLHFYTAITLLAIAVGVVALCWCRRLIVRSALVTLATCSLAVTVSFLWQWSLYQESGLPTPFWRAPVIPLSIFLLAYPLACALIAWGVADYWRKADLDACFLLGWALGCTLLTLAGPFYPWPDRGTLTLQIPLFIVAGSIYFARWRRVTPWAALVAVVVLGATPAFEFRERQWWATKFQTDAPYLFMSSAHREVIDLLRERASRHDTLLADEPDVLWLAPEYPGNHYAGHWFLTVDYQRKRAEVKRLLDGSMEDPAAFLRQEGIRFLYVDAGKAPQRFEYVHGLVLLRTEPVGALFEFTERGIDVLGSDASDGGTPFDSGAPG